VTAGAYASRRSGALRLAACACLASSWATSAAWAGAPLPSGEELGRVEAALQKGAYTEAIGQLELWSDQGVVHPDLSFDRGVAYLGRAESPARRRADLGQAVAAFEEAASLDPSDDEAGLIIDRVRAKISERRAKGDGGGVVARPRLARALLGLISENVWAGLGAGGALLLSLGLVARLAARGRQLRLSGAIAAVFGLVLTGLGAGMALVGFRLRAHAAPAVVIVEEARLHDGQGRPVATSRSASTLSEATDRVPEGTLVHISDTRGALVEVEWGDSEAWLDAREVRRLSSAR
jgi:hypothetical protein